MRKSDATYRLVLAALAGGIVGAIITLLAQKQPLHLAPVGMSYSDLSATLLSAVSVLVTILGVFIAVLAIWGYSQFQGIASAAAKAHVNEELKDGALRTHVEGVVRQYMTAEFESGTLRKLLEERVDTILFSGASERAKEKRGTEEEDEDHES